MRIVPHRSWQVSLWGLLIALLIVAGSHKGIAQVVSIYSAQPIDGGARNAGFADAAIADPQDMNSMYTNPASMIEMQRKMVVFNHTQEREILGMNENLAIPLVTRKSEAIAIGFTLNHVGYIGDKSKTDFRVMQYGYNIAYAREIIPTFSVGGNIDVRYAKTSVSSLWGIASALGVYYSPSQEVSYGAVFNGIGSGILFASDRQSTTLSAENLPRSLQGGMTLRYPEGFNKTVFTLSVANEKIFGESGIIYKGGLEVFLYNLLALRGGYVVAPNSNFARFGLGIRTQRVLFDYAVSPSHVTDQASHFSLAIQF